MYLTRRYWLLITVNIGVFISLCVCELIPCGENDELIDSDKKQCCAGKVEPKFNGKKCCYEARDFYFTRDSICCGGNIIPKYMPSGERLGCCNTNVIDLNNTKCCLNTERKLPTGHGGSFGCCGTELIDWKQKRCCEHPTNSFLSRSYNRQLGTFCCGSKLGKKHYDWCKNEGQGVELLSRNRDRCEGQEINLLEKSCCAGKINDVPRNDVNHIYAVNADFGCCGATAYNKSEKKCCMQAGVTIPNLEHLQCSSNGSSFDKRVWMQCGGLLNRRNNTHTECCGNATFDPYTQGCCDKHIYNTDTEFCCGYEGAKPLSKSKVCCDGLELRPDHICCDGLMQVVKDDTSHDKCCINPWTEIPASYDSRVKECRNGEISTQKKDMEICENQLFSSKQAACCDGLLHYFKKDTSGTIITSKCCGMELLNNDEVCCYAGVKVHKSKDDHDDCCMDTEGQGSVQSFNSKQQFCKDGQLHLHYGGLDNCGDTYYTPRSGVCCMGSLHLHPKGAKLKCCHPGTAAFDERWQTCCHGNVYNVSSNNAECCEGMAFQIDDPANPCRRTCADKFYDHNIYICCNNELHLRGRKGDACCQGQPYLTAHKTCCDGVLYNIPTEKGKCCGKSFIHTRHGNLKCCENFMPYNKRESICKSSGIPFPKRSMTLDKRFSRSGIKRRDGYPANWCFAKIGYTAIVHKWKQISGKRTEYKLRNVKKLCRFNLCKAPRIRKLTIVLHLNKQTQKDKFLIPKGSRIAVFFNKTPRVDGKRKATLHLREKDMGYVVRYSRRVQREMAKITIEQCLKIYFAMDFKDKKVWKISKDPLWFAGS